MNFHLLTIESQVLWTSCAVGGLVRRMSSYTVSDSVLVVDAEKMH